MSDVDDVISSWGRIVRWLDLNAPGSFQALKPPATDAEISLLNSALGFEVPDVLEALLRINNGSTAKDAERPIPGGIELLPHADSMIFPMGKVLHGCKEIVRQHAEYLYAAREMGDSEYWKESWIPVVEMPDAPYGFILDAEQKGGSCPLLSFSEASRPRPYADSLGDALGAVADVLEHGRPSALSLYGECAGVEGGRIVWT